MADAPTAAPAVAHAYERTLLTADRIRAGWDPTTVVRVDHARRGAVAICPRPFAVRRAEPGPAGPLLLDARSVDGSLVLEVRGPTATPADAAAAALEAARAWVGARDAPHELAATLSAYPRLRDVARRLGPVRLGRLPTIGEAVGRAVLAQLVQAVEARRSMAQVAALAGSPAGEGLWCWPTPRQLGGTPAWSLRRCGVSLRAVRALHAAAVDDARLARADERDGLDAVESRLRALPGIGAWTCGKVRAALGDPDAVPVGDWNLPAAVCTALTGEDRGRTGWTDDDLLTVLAPFAGQRGRVIRLVTRAAGRGLLPRARRRSPRAPRSAHRYW